MKEEIKNECLRRMKALKLHDEGKHTVVGSFRENGEVWKSEFEGILYWLDEEEKELVKQFEEEHENYKVYHCIKSYTQFGEMLALLYVNGKEEYFEEDKQMFDEDLQEGYLFAYVCNMEDEFCSEFGSIGIKSINGGIKRTF
jgi:hypothetical protein